MLKLDIEDKTIQDLVAKINHKIENELYESLHEFHKDYFLLSSYVTFYYYDVSNYKVNILDFIEKVPENMEEPIYKWCIQETKPESNE